MLGSVYYRLSWDERRVHMFSPLFLLFPFFSFPSKVWICSYTLSYMDYGFPAAPHHHHLHPCIDSVIMSLDGRIRVYIVVHMSLWSSSRRMWALMQKRWRVKRQAGTPLEGPWGQQARGSPSSFLPALSALLSDTAIDLSTRWDHRLAALLSTALFTLPLPANKSWTLVPFDVSRCSLRIFFFFFSYYSSKA